MTPVEKGRFCGACQKAVHDFTRSSDREIASAFKRDKEICGRFANSQLNRELYIPKEKGSILTMAFAAVISFFTLGNHSVSAQEPTGIIQQDTPEDDHKQTTPVVRPMLVTGTVSFYGRRISDAIVINKTKNLETKTTFTGQFTIVAAPGDSLEIAYQGYGKQLLVNEATDYIVVLEKKEAQKEDVKYSLGGAIMGVEIKSKESIREGTYTSIWDLLK